MCNNIIIIIVVVPNIITCHLTKESNNNINNLIADIVEQ